MATHQAVATGAVTMTRQEAEDVMRLISKRKIMCVNVIKSIPRRRSWLPSVKAMTIAERTEELKTLDMLAERIGTVFNLGGY